MESGGRDGRRAVLRVALILTGATILVTGVVIATLVPTTPRVNGVVVQGCDRHPTFCDSQAGLRIAIGALAAAFAAAIVVVAARAFPPHGAGTGRALRGLAATALVAGGVGAFALRRTLVSAGIDPIVRNAPSSAGTASIVAGLATALVLIVVAKLSERGAARPASGSAR